MNHDNKVEAVEKATSRTGDPEAGTNTSWQHDCGEKIPVRFNSHIYDNLLVLVEQQIECSNRSAVCDPNPKVGHAL